MSTPCSPTAIAQRMHSISSSDLITPRQLGDAHAVDDFDAARFERLGHGGIDVLHRNPAPGAAKLVEIG